MHIKKQLIFWGDLAAHKAPENTLFDNTLEQAVKAFQRRHFLAVDGIIGPKTAYYLNRPLKDVLKIINLNIERLKSFIPPNNQSHNTHYVWINIPTYHLYAIENEQVIQDQKVIVGTKKTKTPLLKTNITSITLNPAWGVPTSIFMRSLYTHVLQDPEFLSRKNYIVHDVSGEQINPLHISWSNLSHNYFPYLIRQLPGPQNSLGHIKFNMDNKDAIYMHDTPLKELFNRVQRAYSAGCIRLSAPLKLAAWCLKNTHYGSVDNIQFKIDLNKTATLPLQEPMPVIMTYFTAIVDPNFGLMLSDDPYGYDHLNG